MEPFFRTDGDAFVATASTRGPWDAHAQHGGPPAALLGWVLERHHDRAEMQTVRVTVDILRPVPITGLRVRPEVVRDGKRVALLAAVLTDTAGQEVMRASAWRIRTADLPLGVGVEGSALPGPDGLVTAEFPWALGRDGYGAATEFRFLSGGFTQPGPATAWARLRVPLVDDEPVTPLARVLALADSGNGVAGRFEGLYINPDLTVYLTRPVEGEWVALDARATLTDHGIGLAESVIHDRRGPAGRGLQSLLLDRRDG